MFAMNIQKAAAALGSIGGKNGIGESKRRTSEHYSRISKIAWQKRRKPISERFWEKVEKRGEDECWPWMGYKDPLGYGRFGVNGKALCSHRVAYEFSHGVKIKHCVLHHCDNPCCVNPKHLFEGTDADNVKDKMAKGRMKSTTGILNGRAKLTADDIVKIRSDPRFIKVIAIDYGVHFSTISYIKLRKSWKHIP